MADLRLSTEELQPLVKEVLKVVLAEQNQVQQLLNGKMAIREEQAAELLGLNPWQLRDLRLAGKIGFHRIVGNRRPFRVRGLDHTFALRVCRLVSTPSAAWAAWLGISVSLSRGSLPRI